MYINYPPPQNSSVVWSSYHLNVPDNETVSPPEVWLYANEFLVIGTETVHWMRAFPHVIIRARTCKDNLERASTYAVQKLQTRKSPPYISHDREEKVCIASQQRKGAKWCTSRNTERQTRMGRPRAQKSSTFIKDSTSWKMCRRTNRSRIIVAFRIIVDFWDLCWENTLKIFGSHMSNTRSFGKWKYPPTITSTFVVFRNSFSCFSHYFAICTHVDGGDGTLSKFISAL